MTDLTALTTEQVSHLERVIGQHDALTVAKFCNGQREHGGDLHRKPGMLAHALDEAADLPVYLWTLREQLVGIASDAEARGEHETATAIRRLLTK